MKVAETVSLQRAKEIGVVEALKEDRDVTVIVSAANFSLFLCSSRNQMVEVAQDAAWERAKTRLWLNQVTRPRLEENGLWIDFESFPDKTGMRP